MKLPRWWLLALAAPVAVAAECPREAMPMKWQICAKQSDCVSIYLRCKSEPVAKRFEKRARKWLKSCTSCDSAAVPIPHAVCQEHRCHLDPPLF